MKPLAASAAARRSVGIVFVIRKSSHGAEEGPTAGILGEHDFQHWETAPIGPPNSRPACHGKSPWKKGSTTKQTPTFTCSQTHPKRKEKEGAGKAPTRHKPPPPHKKPWQQPTLPPHHRAVPSA